MKKMKKGDLHMERTITTTLTGAEVKKALSTAVGGIYKGKDIYRCAPISIFKDFMVTEEGIVIKLNSYTTMTIKISDDDIFDNLALPRENVYDVYDEYGECDEWYGNRYFEYAVNLEDYDMILCFNTSKANNNEVTVEMLSDLVGDGHSDDLRYTVVSNGDEGLSIEVNNAYVRVHMDDEMICILSDECADGTIISISFEIIDKIYNYSLKAGYISYIIVFNNDMLPIAINMCNRY